MSTKSNYHELMSKIRTLFDLRKARDEATLYPMIIIN